MIDAGSHEVVQSLWLPIGRGNFYNAAANDWLVKKNGRCTSSAIADPGYSPHLQVSVMRRVLEVLPRSFGYRSEGTYVAARPDDPRSRPISVTMTLDVPAAHPGFVGSGITQVDATVGENGFYTFTAMVNGERTAAQQALRAHVGEVFGGDFRLDWHVQSQLRNQDENPSPGDAASNVAPDQDELTPGGEYNGHDERGKTTGRPLGILTFFQLNTLLEGMFNDALTPAVFFEDYAFMQAWRDNTTRATSVVHTMHDVIKLISMPHGVSTDDARALTLRHFLSATSRDTLQRLKWSLESVRRSLLDEMMGILHRQSPMIQLKLDKSDTRTPELAVGANESQLRGYVMLVSAKLPLIANVHRAAATTAEQLGLAGPGFVPDGPTFSTVPEAALRHYRDLGYRLREWRDFLEALSDGVRGLERAIEHAWMERLLYEQEQSRAEQEAMAEIERSRTNRPATAALGGGPYSAVMLVATVSAALFAFAAIPSEISIPAPSGWQQFIALLPLAVLAVVFIVVVPLLDRVRLGRNSRTGTSSTYGYEFAFRLDSVVDPSLVTKFLASRAGGRSRWLSLTPRGGCRLEYISQDATLIKLHSVVVFKVKGGLLRRYARFEVISEILARKVSDVPQYFLRECRMFGDSPRMLSSSEVMDLARAVLDNSAITFMKRPMTSDQILAFAKPIFR